MRRIGDIPNRWLSVGFVASVIVTIIFVSVVPAFALIVLLLGFAAQGKFMINQGHARQAEQRKAMIRAERARRARILAMKSLP